MPAPMESIKSMIDETVSTIFKDFRFGKMQAEKMMLYCRPAVERFIFSKLSQKLM